MKYMFSCQIGSILGHQGAVRSVAKQMNKETGFEATTEEVASELGKRGHQGAVRYVAKQMKKETGVEATMEEAASELGKRGHQGAFSSMSKQMKKETGVEATKKEAASELGKRGTRTSPDKASGAHTLKNGKITMSMSKSNACRDILKNWSMEDDTMIVSMIKGGSSCADIPLALNNSHRLNGSYVSELNHYDINNSWHNTLKELSGINKPYVQPVQKVQLPGPRRTMQRL